VRVTAVLLSYPPARWVGAEIATHALLRTMADRGHEVSVLALEGGSEGVPEHDGVPVRELLPGALEGLHGLLVTHPYAMEALRGPVEGSGLPVVVLAHSDRPEIVRALERRRRDVLVVNSLATARGLGASPGDGTCFVVHPPLSVPDSNGDSNRPSWSSVDANDLDSNADSNVDRGLWAPFERFGDRPLVGFVNGTVLKGGWTVEQTIAEGLEGEDYRFVGVPGGYGGDTLEFTPEAAGRMLARQLPPAGMEGYFARIAVHVQPSLSESWGMTALEALARGVPVVSARTPGTDEALAGFGPRWVRWIGPGAARPNHDLDRGVRALLAAGPPTAAEDRERAEEVERVRRTSAFDASVLVRALERRYG
jgi:hypothetical protein